MPLVSVQAARTLLSNIVYWFVHYRHFNKDERGEIIVSFFCDLVNGELILHGDARFLHCDNIELEIFWCSQTNLFSA